MNVFQAFEELKDTVEYMSSRDDRADIQGAYEGACKALTALEGFKTLLKDFRDELEKEYLDLSEPWYNK